MLNFLFGTTATEQQLIGKEARNPRMHFISDAADYKVSCPPGENTALYRRYFSSPTLLTVHTHKIKIKTKPKCILCVKTPFLLFSVSEGTEEHADLSRALVQIRELISAVDQRVSQYEQNQKLSEVLGRMENKCSTKLKSGYTFRKQDITSGRALLHQGPLLWKTATGRLKGEKVNCPMKHSTSNSSQGTYEQPFVLNSYLAQ